jgi:hypothetical protein
MAYNKDKLKIQSERRTDDEDVDDERDNTMDNEVDEAFQRLTNLTVKASAISENFSGSAIWGKGTRLSFTIKTNSKC